MAAEQGTAAMLSRVAESIYWMGRYVERAEDTARVVNVNAHLMLDLPRGLTPDWKPLVDIFGLGEAFVDRYGEYNERQVVRFLVTDKDNPSSLLSSLAQARESARTIRDHLPREAWERLNELYLFAADNTRSGLARNARHDYLNSIIFNLHALSGLLNSCMNHDAGQEFLKAGALLERADMTTRIVDVRSTTLVPDGAADLAALESIQWASVLRSLTALQMYRRTMQMRVRRVDALRFLIRNDSFPRAVYHCLMSVDEALARLSNGDDPRRAVTRAMRATPGRRHHPARAQPRRAARVPRPASDWVRGRPRCTGGRLLPARRRGRERGLTWVRHSRIRADERRSLDGVSLANLVSRLRVSSVVGQGIRVITISRKVLYLFVIKRKNANSQVVSR